MLKALQTELANTYVQQGCQFSFFEVKFVIFNLFSTPLAFLFLKKGQMKIAFIWPILTN